MTANPTDAEGNSEQKTDDVATQTDENNVVKYLIIGIDCYGNCWCVAVPK